MADNQGQNLNPNSANIGLNTDSTLGQVQPGQLTYALNAVVQGFDGHMITYQNEQASYKCISFATGWKVIGVKSIPQLKRVLFWLTNPSTGDSEIRYADNDACTSTVLISDVGNDCKLGFSVDYPIRKAVVKSTNCSTQVYWTDGLNPRRYIDFDSLPWKEQINPNNDFVPIQLVGQVDCNKLNVQPNFSVPKITPLEVVIGGQLQMGTYQFAIQYSDANGNGYTSYYSVTNPLGIFESRFSSDYNGPTSKAIKLRIDNLDTTGLYEHVNIAVIKTINNNPSVELVGTYAISNRSIEITYTGESKSDIRLTVADIFEKFPYYDVAGDVFEVDNIIGWDILQADERLNYQNIWAKVKLFWETYKVPYNKFEAYNNGVNTSQYRGYFRDEVYAMEGVFILKNGKQTDSFPIPGRLATPFDREIIVNADASSMQQNPCTPAGPKQRWQVYNTGNVIGFSPEYTSYNGDQDCYIGPFQYGEMGYWESTEKYPNNPLTHGILAGQNIRHHKLPDCLISPIYSHDGGDPRSAQYFIYPMGIKVDMQSLYDAIQASGLTQAQKDEIQGFKIVRGNRKTHEGIIAKGMMNNVGSSTYYDKKRQAPDTSFYANYPYNDLHKDPYYTTIFRQRDGIIPPGYNPDIALDGFTGRPERFVFHSPDTHFYQPSLSNGGEFLKLETIEYGTSYGHFVQVKENAQYKFLTRDTIYAAAALGIASGLVIGAGTYGWPEYSMAPVAPTFNSAQELFEKLSPFTNFGYAFHSFGIYNNSHAIKNDGWKVRTIDFNKYVIDGMNSVENGQKLNNIRRESAVYLHITNNLLYPHEYSNNIPQDTSRYNLASIGGGVPEQIRQRPISSYYASIKREVPDQWGKISSYETIDTGFYHELYDREGNKFPDVPTVFGGDIFINRFAWKQKQSIFTDTSVKENNGTDIQYNELGTLNYPMFWLSTKPANFDIDLQPQMDNLIDEIFDAGFLQILGNILTGGAIGAAKAMAFVKKLFTQIYERIGIKNVNFDQASTVGITEQGLMYLFVYGIPYFFVESAVNVDYRQASNEREGNFFPNVSSDIPDDWLQEVNVPIIHDNTYFYNQTYSKQNKENFFSHLRPDYDPAERCKTDFPNRAIWSDKSSMEGSKNNWLVYRPSNYFDFPKSNGALTAIDRLEHNQLLVRYENKSQLYNALTTVAVKEGVDAYVGSGQLFSGAPALDLSDTDVGHAGSQHKFMLHTEFGHVFIDAKRGQVILMRGTQMEDLAMKGMDKWFKEHLPFRILETFPDYPIDNNFNGIGLHGVYDPIYKRLIITKNDYQVKQPDRVRTDNSRFYSTEPVETVAGIVPTGRDKVVIKDEPIPTDPPIFCDRSWTLSYSFITNSWTSWHSYRPKYYIPYPNHFDTGIDGSTWRHNKLYDLYNNFYDTQYPYILEYPFAYKIQDEILQNVREFATVRKYTNYDTFYEPDETIYFNKSIIYNGQQCTGVRNLIPKAGGNLSAYNGYPKFNPDSIDIQVTKADNLYNYNMFWDIVKDKNAPFFESTCEMGVEDKALIDSNLDYSKRDFRKASIRAKDAKIRHILDNRSDVRMINKFILAPTTPSYK